MRLVLLVLVAALAGLFLFQKHSKAAEESRLAAIAGEIASRPVSIHCQGAVGEALDVTAEAGSVEFDGTDARLMSRTSSGTFATASNRSRSRARALNSAASTPPPVATRPW